MVVTQFEGETDLSPDASVQRVKEAAKAVVRGSLDVAIVLFQQRAQRLREMQQAAERDTEAARQAITEHVHGSARATLAEIRQTTGTPGYWDTARPEDVARMWADGRAQAGVNPDLDGVTRGLASQMRDRWGVDPEEMWQAHQARDRARNEGRDGHRPEDRHRPGAEHSADPSRSPDGSPRYGPGSNPGAPGFRVDGTGQATPQRPGPGWDTEARRRLLAERLNRSGMDPEAAQARLIADRSDATPPSAATTPQPQQPPVQQKPAPGVQKTPQPPTLGR